MDDEQLTLCASLALPRSLRASVTDISLAYMARQSSTAALLKDPSSASALKCWEPKLPQKFE